MGEYARALEEAQNETLGYILLSMGRGDEALARLRQLEAQTGDASLKNWYTSLGGALDGRHAESVDACEAIVRSTTGDPEVLYHMARTLARWASTARAGEAGIMTPCCAGSPDSWSSRSSCSDSFTSRPAARRPRS